MPNGTKIDEKTASIEHGKSKTYEYYIVRNPEKGIWKFNVKPVIVPKKWRAIRRHSSDHEISLMLL